MTDQLQRVEAAFLAAMECRERTGGQPVAGTLLDRLCDHNSAVRKEVQSLLSHLDRAGIETSDSGAFLNPVELHGSHAVSLGYEATLQEWGGEAVGQRIGDFVLIGELGRGGMGIVFVAEQRQPRRKVALKVVRRALATAHIVARFRREAELMGRLSHPGIAQIYAAGVADVQAFDSGTVPVPYIAMELVEGLSILDYVSAHRSSMDTIVRLVAQACDAVQHAHQRGVIHRDLKPANVMVSTFNGEPAVKVLDFGVARTMLSHPPGDDLTLLTRVGHMIGTPAYMSPEQIAGDGENVDGRTDVYAMGMILFELLAGKQALDLTSCSLAEVVRRITEDEPARLGAINPKFRGDLETIICKAIAKQRDRRYQSAADLARDLRCLLNGDAIEARRDSLAREFSRRAVKLRKLLLIMSAATAVIISSALYQAHRRHDAAQTAEDGRRVSERLIRDLSAQLTSSRISQARMLIAGGDISAAEDIVWSEFLKEPRSLLALSALGDLCAAAEPSAAVRIRPILATFSADIGPQTTAALSRDGRRLATVSGNNVIVWQLDATWAGAHPTRHAALAVNRGSPLTTLGFSPDNSLLAGRDGNRVVHVWNIKSGADMTILAAPLP